MKMLFKVALSTAAIGMLLSEARPNRSLVHGQTIPPGGCICSSHISARAYPNTEVDWIGAAQEYSAGNSNCSETGWPSLQEREDLPSPGWMNTANWSYCQADVRARGKNLCNANSLNNGAGFVAMDWDTYIDGGGNRNGGLWIDCGDLQNY